jgi:diguanylate cyclase (GGDEF)-like protein
MPIVWAVEVTVDSYGRRRRRTVEAATLMCRVMGFAAIALQTPAAIGSAAAPLVTAMRVSMVIVLAVMVAASAFSVANFVRPEGPRFRPYGIVQVAADTAVACTAVFWLEMYRGHPAWPMLVIPIAVAAQRLRLGGTLAVWAVAAGSMVGGYLVVDHPAIGIDSMRNAVSTLLIVAILTGAQSNAYARQVTQLQLARQQLEYQAGHDMLTGLPNRVLVERFAASVGDRALGVLLLDLDGFKHVNDTRGHAAGDAVLTEVGRRIERVLRAGDMAARLGGDEFMVLLLDADQKIAESVADRLRESICRPIRVDGATVDVGVSIGASSRARGDAADVAELTAAADTAMYREKELARSGR